MQNSYDGKNCIILGCGPSLNELTQDKLLELSKTNTIFAIKQAYYINPQVIDFHFVNDNNYSHYDYSLSQCCVIAEFPLNHFVGAIADTADYIFKVDNSNFNNSLTVTHDFNTHTFFNTLLRPWGPGIMYEVVFFFAHYLGFKNISTIGWDLAPNGVRDRDHFYNDISFNLFNKAHKISPDEASKEIDLSLAFYKWFKEQNINLYVGSNSYAHIDIPRINL